MMEIRKVLPLLTLTFLLSTAALASLSHAASVCIGEGTMNITSTATLTTPQGNFTIDFLFLVNVTASSNGYNVTVLAKVVRIAGPPILLQAKLPLFDLAVSTDQGVYRWSDGKVFAAVMLPLSSGTVRVMSVSNITSCIRSITIDASGLGLPGVVTVGKEGLSGNAALGLSQSASLPTSETTTRASSTYTTTNYLGGGQPVNAVYAGTGESAEGIGKEGMEGNAVAAVIALLAAMGAGLILYALFT